MADKKNIKYKPKAISGYPEWLPEFKIVEQEWFDNIRNIFESYGFCPIETPSVEELAAIEAKGAADKEIYVLQRLHADENEKKEARLALHFDLTVPLARYTAQHFNDLDFPFKRYQMQRVWRGERPQKGRFREFYQCDIDVINIDNLPLHFDAEMPRIMHEIYTKLDIPEKIQIRISNRKILVGFLKSLNIEANKISDVTRNLDKLDKIGKDNVIDILTNEIGLNKDIAKKSIEFTQINGNGVCEQIKADNEDIKIGLDELNFVMENLTDLDSDKVEIIHDMSVIRGLDYYTGTIIEASFKENKEFGAIGAGGRYDDLTGNFINKKMPGIGVSIGLTRLFSYMKDKKYIRAKKYSPTQILVIQNGDYKTAINTANTLRKRGFKVELFHNDTKLKKQISYAEKKSIPYIWFPAIDDDSHEIKDMQNREQKTVNIKTWQID